MQHYLPEWLFRYPLWRLPTGLLLFKIWWLMVRREAMNRVNVHQPLLIMIHGPNLGYQFVTTSLVIFSKGMIHHFDPPPYVCIHDLVVVNCLIKIDLGFGATIRLVKSHETYTLLPKQDWVDMDIVADSLPFSILGCQNCNYTIHQGISKRYT